MPQPPWKPLLIQHLGTLNPPNFALATISSNAAPLNPPFCPPGAMHPPPPSIPSLVPRVRTMIYRGFFGTLPANPHTPLPNHNPPIMTSDMLTFTTDARMTKTGELTPDHTSGGDATRGTCGGAEVEMCFWMEEPQNQWRVRGRCYLLAEEDVDTSHEIQEELKKRMEFSPEGDKDQWSWKKEVQAHFANLAPAMRGSFSNPPPGTPVNVDLSQLENNTGGGEQLKKGTNVKNEDVLKMGGPEEIARRNMRVGVVVPEVVERVDLAADDKTARRWVWWFVGEQEGEGVKDGWKEIETFP
ncbi:Similar to Uncharacterized protein YGR017W; acc. no. P53210 [Pyronema omphalodes CBS 100304]|uniref:Similar to Uncharacterized protein YGR017W acc. no. P53210 n=1 Tax=Pyronema omphalodes (strain CBS 100304) TaxID=1076935 RepID=U4LL96_PYROM|nr:Similar to Uncharacterized protein YGR017W; acc. no. P53210 [Pyronema omphalodes CBS 100304]